MEAKADLSSSACAHHWIIESPSGESSIGKCKLCGESRSFPNEANRAFYVSKKPAAPLNS
jgi:hypothetical protein